MANEWWRHLRGRPFYWAVDGTHPAADLFVLRHVMGRPKRSRGLNAARLALQVSPKVEALITRLEQKSASLWARYDSPLWTLSMLAELGVRGDDERIAEALDWALNQQIEVDGAPINANAILLHIALAFGFSDDERVQTRLTRLQDEICTLSGASTEQAEWLTVAAMALAEQPEAERDVATVASLSHHLKTLEPANLTYYQRHGFPIFDQPDDLVLAQAALRLNIAGQWLQPWIERIENAQDERGLWHLDRALPTPASIAWEAEGEPSRWISAKAMYVLRAFYGE